MLQWTGTAHTHVPPAAAFAYLADPQHAPAWFAHITIADLAPGPPRVGQRWRIVEHRQWGTPSAKPARMSTFDSPRRFTWETQLPRWRTNLVWDVECAPDPEGGTTLALSLRWRPGLLDWPVTLAGAILGGQALVERAQRTVERARDAVEAAYPAPGARRSTGKRRKRQ
jgi:hypothetical protein